MYFARERIQGDTLGGAQHLCDLLGQLTGLGLLQLGDTGLRLGSEQTTAPVTADFIEALIVVVLDSLNHLGQVQLVT